MTLPSREDFRPPNGRFGDPDDQYAWDLFGGLTLDQANHLFCENPLSYQEGFMWMGDKAFPFYFPVLDRYLRGVIPVSEYDYLPVWIIASDIKWHVDNSPEAESLHGPILSLCDYVISHMSEFKLSEDYQRDSEEAWQELRLLTLEAKARRQLQS